MKKINSIIMLMVLFLNSGHCQQSKKVELYNKTAIQEAKVFPEGMEVQNGDYAKSVALDGAFMVIGARNMGDRGLAFVYEYTGNQWVLLQQLDLANVIYSADFGTSVDIENDTIVVGARFGGVSTSNRTGAAFVYERNNVTNTWEQIEKLIPSDGPNISNFGKSVKLSQNRLMVGGSEKVYYFEHMGTNWAELEILTPLSGGITGDRFGENIDFDGNFAVMGAPNNDSNDIDSGVAYIFEFKNNSWIQVTLLSSPNSGVGNKFAQSVSLSGNRLLIGEPSNGNGKAYLFEMDDTGTWGLLEEIVPNFVLGTTISQFGRAIGVSASSALVSCKESTNGFHNLGRIYVFENVNSSGYVQAEILQASDDMENNEFGYSFSLSGTKVLVGAYRDSNQLQNSGSAYIFSNLDGFIIFKNGFE